MTSRQSHQHSDGGSQLPEEETARADAEGAQESTPEAASEGQAATEGYRNGEGSAASATAEVEQWREKHLRLAAEFDNYRKRTERERGEMWSRAQANLAERLLDAFDDLDRVAHLDPEKTPVDSVLEGVRLVERKLLRALESAGLEIVDAAGRPFDPEVHEALMSSPTEEPEADETVAEVFQKGYSFKGQLLRPARVRVNKFQE